MELFKTVEDKVLYVETLTCLVTIGEKVTEGNKLLIYNILSNYGLPQDYADRIWRKVRQRQSLDDILAPIKDKEMNFKLLLVQEVIMTYLAGNKYREKREDLINICSILGINIKLESLKERVLEVMKQSNVAKKQSK